MTTPTAGISQNTIVASPDNLPLNHSLSLLENGEHGISLSGSFQESKFTSRTSEEVQIIKSEIPSIPSGLTSAFNTVETAIDIAWEANPEPESVVGYRVFREDLPINVTELIEDSTLEASDGSDASEALPLSDSSNYWNVTNTSTDISITQSWNELRLVERLELDWRNSFYSATKFSIYALIDDQYVRIQDFSTDSRFSSNVIELPHAIPTTSIKVVIDEWYSSTGRLYKMSLYATQFQHDATSLQDVPGDGVHSYSVSAINKYGFESQPSASSSPVPFGDVTPPEAVILTLSVDGSTVNLSWNSVTDAVGYKVYRDDLLIKDLTEVLLADPALANGSYDYHVTALDAVGNESEISNIETAVINISLLTSPLNLTATGNTERLDVSLAWDHVSDIPATAFNIYRSLETGGNYEYLATTSDSVYLDEDIESNIDYFYVVVAVDDLGNESAHSNEANAMSSDLTAPDMPVIKTPTQTGTLYQSPSSTTDIGGIAEPDSLVYLIHQGLFIEEPVRSSKSTELLNIGSFDLMKVSPNGKTVAMNDRRGDFYFIENKDATVIEELNSLTGQYVNSLIWTKEENLLIFQATGAYLFDL